MRSVCCVCEKRGRMKAFLTYLSCLRRDFWVSCLGGFFGGLVTGKHMRGVCCVCKKKKAEEWEVEGDSPQFLERWF